MANAGYISREYICNGKSGRGHNQVSLHSPVNFHSQEQNTILIKKMHLYMVQTFLKIVITIIIIINKIKNRASVECIVIIPILLSCQSRSFVRFLENIQGLTRFDFSW